MGLALLVGNYFEEKLLLLWPKPQLQSIMGKVPHGALMIYFDP